MRRGGGEGSLKHIPGSGIRILFPLLGISVNENVKRLRENLFVTFRQMSRTILIFKYSTPNSCLVICEAEEDLIALEDRK